ncbi:MAG: hypothetical protein ACRDD7_11610 [Peptostreptococcaceae bacterium]
MYNEIERYKNEIEAIAQNILKNHTVKHVEFFGEYILENNSGDCIIMNENFFIMNKSIKALLNTIDREVKMIETYAGELETYYNKLVDSFYSVLKNTLLEAC